MADAAIADGGKFGAALDQIGIETRGGWWRNRIESRLPRSDGEDTAQKCQNQAQNENKSDGPHGLAPMGHAWLCRQTRILASLQRFGNGEVPQATAAR
jgi:hypothetical protein